LQVATLPGRRTRRWPTEPAERPLTDQRIAGQLADMMILASLPIAGCTLAASIAASVADRKRPFSLLRPPAPGSAGSGAWSRWKAPSRS
jgi:hypothetical protein